MDLGMPFAERKAWETLKKSVNDYATFTSNEVAIVTSYTPSSNNQAVDNAPLTTEKSLAIHGHGELLRRVQDSLERVKSVPAPRAGDTVNGWGTQAMSNNIPIAHNDQGSQQSHHNQAVARSLSSSFRSLKLDQLGVTGFRTGIQDNSSKTGPGYVPAPRSGRQSSNKPTVTKKSSRPMNIDKGDLELDENLLFDEPSYGMSGDENEEYDEFRDSDDSTDLSENSFGRPSNFLPTSRVVHSAAAIQANPNQYATSLPVTINITWGAKPDGAPHFRDNQGPHPPLQYQQNANHSSKQPTVVRPSIRTNANKDTPDPETMMASMQALARSVNNDSAMIFGERPRPRLNTGELRMTRPKR